MSLSATTLAAATAEPASLAMALRLQVWLGDRGHGADFEPATATIHPTSVRLGIAPELQPSPAATLLRLLDPATSPVRGAAGLHAVTPPGRDFLTSRLAHRRASKLMIDGITLKASSGSAILLDGLSLDAVQQIAAAEFQYVAPHSNPTSVPFLEQ